MMLHDYLADCDPRFDPQRQMLGMALISPGYHTRVPNGTWTHPLRESLDYALGLLESGTAAQSERAAGIIRAVLAMQETDPYKATYGIWPWLQEEPLDQMAPPDWNWADFIGSRLAQMLATHPEQLAGDLQAAMREALGHAAWSIFRRNIQPNYTNIAIMGAGVTLAAGELLAEPRLLEYGARRLHAMVEHTERHGGFNEYNSPTYTIVALEEAERILMVVRDPAARADAEWIRRAAWATIAEHFHPPTQQWGAPYSRTYGDRLAPEYAAFLAEYTGVPIAAHPQAVARRADYSNIHHLPCPPELVARFRALPEPEQTVVRRFILREPEATSTVGTTWLTEQFCLGSINYDTLWTQRRPLLGYWATPEDPAVVLRLRFLHDGEDFASAAVRTVQQGGRALSAVGLIAGAGDFHPSLDRPADGLFSAETFVVRYELSGTGVQARELDVDCYELRAGNQRAVIHTAPGCFGAASLHWQLSETASGVALEGVCYSGPRRSFDLAAIGDTVIVAGLELLAADAAPSDDALLVTSEGATLSATWGELALQVPTRLA